MGAGPVDEHATWDFGHEVIPCRTTQEGSIPVKTKFYREKQLARSRPLVFLKRIVVLSKCVVIA